MGCNLKDKGIKSHTLKENASLTTVAAPVMNVATKKMHKMCFSSNSSGAATSGMRPFMARVRYVGP